MPDDIRCPMCAKNNPAGTEICRHCGARLTPLGKTPPGSSASSSAPDWLSDLRSTTGDEPANLPWQDQPSDDLPDWLAEVRGSSSGDAPSPDESASSEKSGADWLSELSNQEEPPARASEIPGVDDWLANLRVPSEAQDSLPANPSSAELSGAVPQDGANPPPAQPAQSLPSAGEDAELAEWLKSLDSDGGAAIFSETPSQPEPEFKWTDDSDADAKNQQTGVTEWLNTMAYEPPPESAPSPAAPSLDEWLSNDGVLREQGDVLPISSQNVAPVEPLPDWLSGASNPAQAEPPSEPLDSGADAGVPDWLAGFGAEQAPPPAPVAASEASDAAGDQTIPSWLSDFSVEKPSAEVPPEPAQSAAENMPTWLSGFAEEPAQPAVPAVAQSEVGVQPTAEPLAKQPLASQPQPVVSEPPQPPALDIPDFAAMFAEEPNKEPDEVQFEESQPETPPLVAKASEPASSQSSIEQTGQAFDTGQAPPDWFADFAEAGKEPVSGQSLLGEIGPSPFIDPQVPDWMSNVQPPSGPAVPESAPALFDEAPQSQPDLESNSPFQVDLPDWLEEAKPAELEAKAENNEEDQELDQAVLPDWVQDMRPLESIIPGAAAVTATDNQKVEKAGPLAGMRGVLAPEEPAAHFRKLPAYTAKLRVSERQRAHAGLLQNLLDIETQPFTVSSETSQTPQILYRLVVAIVLILALLVGMFMGGLNLFPAPAPTGSDASLLALYNEIESVPPGSPVLVAVDYEPGLSGEMRMASTSVIEHLMVRGVNITLVSTVPAGPVLGQELLTVVQQRKPDYDLLERTVNLGYLAGGTTSLLEFSERPINAAPLDYQGFEVWNRPALRGIMTIKNYALVVVLTDSTETGRAWVEQVQPLLGTVPLTIVASAQAGPLLMPYYDSGQIKGLLSGFLGGAMYEQLSGRVNLANTFWNSYQTGYVAGILMLIVGGVISAGLTVVRKPRKAKS